MFDKHKYVLRSVESEAPFIAERMREADKNELELLGRPDALQALMDGIEYSTECYTAYAPDKYREPIAMFGLQVRPDEEPFNIVWLLGTNEVEKHSKKFLRYSRPWTQYFLEAYKRPIGNLVHPENTLHIRWLEWCGFKNHGTFKPDGLEAQFSLYIKSE